MNTTRIDNREDDPVVLDIIQVIWLAGIAVSTSCLLLQVALFALIRSSRKTDEKILTQITVTRIILTICEYCIVYLRPQNFIYFDFIYMLCFVSDFALVTWMLIFTKNLYDKIVVVFSTRKYNLILVSICVWGISLPFGIIGVYLLNRHREYFFLFCRIIFASIKGLILFLNLFIHLRIFHVAIRRSKERTRNVGDVIKSAFVALLLITTTCLQILVTDIISYAHGYRNMMMVKTFCIINSFHPLLITAIFVIILRGKLKLFP